MPKESDTSRCIDPIQPIQNEKYKEELKKTLREDEIICNKCDGSGNDPDNYWMVCPKCQGERKLDWVSAATGVAPKISWGGTSSYSHSSSSGIGILGTSGISDPSHSHRFVKSTYIQPKLDLNDKNITIRGKPISQYIYSVVSDLLAKKIDKEFMESNISSQEQNKNKNRRVFFDNRIISKFLFLSYFKQRIKNKKDKNTI
ncbi:MAG: hypothetical protein ACFFG0_00245 [Candidatus Thorarchaeota archaeon]